MIIPAPIVVADVFVVEPPMHASAGQLVRWVNLQNAIENAVLRPA
jgi:hypothetical protein